MKKLVLHGPSGRAQITDHETWYAVHSLSLDAARTATFTRDGQYLGPTTTFTQALRKASDAIDRDVDRMEIPKRFPQRG